MKKILIFICLNLCLFTGFCLVPPTLQCLQLRNNNTRLYVAWDNSADCASFVKYLVYVNNVLSDSIAPSAGYIMCNYGSLVLNDIPTGTSYNCYLVAKDATGQEWRSNTVQTMPITVLASTDSAFAYITWESPSSQVGATWGDSFYLYKKREFESDFPGTWFATVPNTQFTYTDTADICYGITSYQVGITNYYDTLDHCIFKTVIGSVMLVDRTQPQIPVLDSVTTTADNQVALGFHAPEDYMRGYIIYYDNNGWETIDTIYGATYWIDPNGGSRCYRIAVLDSCFNSSAIVSDAQCNMILSIGAVDACTHTASVNWTEYVNMQGGLAYYEVFTSIDNGATWQSAGTSTTTSLELSDLALNTPYLVFVRAYNTSGTVTAASNRTNMTLSSDASADFSYIRAVSVIDNRYVEITVHTGGDTLAFNTITLQRSKDGVNFNALQTLTHSTSPTYVFIDSSADFSHQLYYYQTYIINDCNIPVGFSNISHNILLTGEATTAQTNQLQWNNYGTWNGEVDNFVIHRKLETETTFNQIPGSLTPSTINTYYDDVSQLYETGSKFTYYVQAHESMNNYGFEDVSNSNYLVLSQSSNTYIPNAFSPLGPQNRIFLPINSFVPTDNYQFTVFSRFGNIVFRTRDPYTGWDGYIDGKVAPMAVYVYRITYTLPDGTPFEKVGSVTLVY